MKTGGWCRMQTWCAVVLLIALSACIRAHDTLTVTDGLKRDSPSRDELQQLIKGELNDGKKRLLQRSLNKELRDRDSINVTPLFTWKLGTIKGTAASTFRSFNQSFILSGKILYRIIEGPGPSNYSTEQVAMFPEFLGEVAFMESVEWDGLLILVTAYKEGLLQLFTVAQTNEVILRQSIACYGIPTDAEFFMQDEKLFLIVSAKNGSALVPTTIYRWYGTQLDEIEDNKHLLIEASAVSTFPFRESVIITVAVGAKGSRTAGLEIFQRTGNKLELIQFLPTSQPSALQHYTFHSENYLLVSMVEGPSIICWWAGTEMIIWDYVKHEESIRSVGVGYIRGETLLLLAEKTRIKVFRPTAASFQFIAEHEFRSTVQSASLYSKDNSLSLLAITELDGQMVPYVLELQLVFKAATVNHIPPGLEDPLLKCISELEYRIRSRRSKLQDISSLSKKLLRISSPGSFKGKLVVRKLVPSGASIRNVTLSQESSTTMVMSGSALKNRIQQSSQNALLLSGSLKNVVMKSTPSTLSGRLTTSELTSNLIKMESVHIADLNNRKFDPSTLLMRNKNQKMTGKVTVDTINVGSLTVGRLNHMKIEELLRKSVDHQTISGLQLVKHVKAKKVDLSANIPINGISISHIVTSKSPDVVTVTGTKTLAGLNLQQLAVGLLNNVNFTQWIASLQQNLPTPMPPRYPGTKTYKSTSNLKVHNLTVNGKINGVPINDLLGTLFLKGLNQHIHGDIVYNSELTVQNLHANQFNEIPTASLLTRHTNQIVSGSLLVEGISGNDIIVEKLNGLKLSEEAAYLNSPLPVSTPVTFSSLESHELILPPKASIAGQQVGRRLLHEPKVIYEGTVRVEGELKLMDVNLEQAKVILDGKPVDFKHLQLNYWTKSDQSIHYIQGSSNELHVENLATSTINGHRPENFVSMSTKNLQGTWHFPNATVVGNLDHALSATQSPVSPKELSAIIVKTSGKYEVSGRKLFLGGLTVTHLSTKTLNSKNVADTLGRVKKGRKYQEIWVGGDLIVYSNLTVGSVNKWNICDRLSNALLIDWPGHIPSATIAAVSAININVSTINGIPFNVINGPNPNYVPRVHKVTLKGNVFLPYFKNVQFINNKSVTTDYLDRVVDKTKIAVIRGRKTFASQLKVHGTFDAVDYNGVKLKDLFDNALSKTRDQTILVPIEIQDVVANELQAYQVNNVDVGNLLSTELKSRQVIEGDLLFTSDIDVSGRLTTGHLSTDTSGRDCPLDRVAARLQTLDGRRWSNLIVLGDLTWSKNLAQRVPGLSYYLGSAVTRSSNQIISGEIKFNGNVAVDNFNSLKQINDIDIVGISMDSLRKSLPRQVIHTHTVFMSRLNTSSVTVLGNVNAKVVDGVKIPNFNNSLVRIDGDQKVAGSKRFLQGFTAKLLKVDTVNGLLSTNIACYDQPMLPPIHFQAPVDVKKDFWFETLDGFKFDDFVAQRVTLDSLQHIDGHITFIRDLSIEGEMVAPRINNLDIGDIVQLDSLEEQDIRGKKQFLQSLRVDGPMEVDNLETVSLRMAYSAALFKDENATIFGDLILGNIATMNSNLDVIDSVNSERISNLVRLLGSHSERNLAGVRSIARTINETNLLLEARGDLSELLYLESVADATVSFTNTYKAIERESDGSESVIDVHGWASYAHCGLPETCLCPAQYTIRTAHGIQSKLDIEWRTGLKHNSTQRSFIFHLKNPFVTVIVKTNTVSRDSRCRLRGVDYLQEVTLLSWVEMGSNEVQREFTVNIAPEPIIGYISDVKTIVIGSRIYVIFGIFYNADLDTNNINSVIVHIDRATRKARIVAEFPTRGVLNLDVFSTAKGQHIVVGNSFDSAAQSTKVSLDIYRFNAITEQLTLVKSVPTDSIVSIVSVVQGGDSLIVIAQKQSYAPVMVLKHDPVHDDYHFVQQLNSNTLPNGLGVFYVGQPGVSDAYLGVTTVDDRFYLYKFNHIEGFKHVMQTELKGAQGLSSFSVGSQQYLLVTSTNTPSIFEIVKQSS